MTRAPYSGPWPPRRGYRLVVVLRGLAALAGLALMTVGYPAALLVVAPRLHLGIPTTDQIITALTRPDDGTLLLQTLAVIAWACWVVFLACLLLELACLARRAATPHLPALGWPQAVAASLIAAITVMLLPVTRATAAPTRPDIIATAVHTPTQTLDPSQPVHHRTRPPAAPTRPGATRAPDRAVIEITVQDGDTLWGLAERHLGYGTRYREIADLNYGRPQPDGDTLTHRHWLTPGWRLLIPDDHPLPGYSATPHDTTPATSPGAPRDTYVVQPHDTLWDIAQTCLGDGERYREIAVLNLRRPQPDGRALIDPDLIQPGWILHLPPATVHDSIHESTDQATGKAGPGDGPTSTPQRGATTPTPAATTAPPGRSVTATPAAEPSVTTVAPTTAPTAPAPDPAADPTAVTAPGPTSGATAPTHTTDAEGIHLNGSFIPWTLAGAITSTIALAWLQRRRRHIPGQLDDPKNLDDDPAALPDPLPVIHHATLTHPDHRPAADLADRAADVPAQPIPPAGGLGLVGDGADAAARAALIAALSSGGPREPDYRAEVVTDRATLARLLDLGSTAQDGITVEPWPRLHLADTPDGALGVIEAELLRRARVLDDDQVPDLATLRIQVPDAEPLPPVLLIAPAPSAAARTRTRAVLTLGAAMGATAVLLGAWEDGITLHITPDGHATPATGNGTTPGPVPAPDGRDQHDEDDRHDEGDSGDEERIAVLDSDTTAAILTTLREAHTGEPPATGPQVPAPPLAPSRPVPPDDPGEPGEQPSPDSAPGDGATGDGTTGDGADGGVVATPSVPVKARLRILGIPEIVNITGSGKPLRSKALELAVFLACHPDGADTRTIGEYLAPDSRLRQADQHVHTSVSNLRHVLGRAGGARKNGYVIQDGGRYRLDPVTVEVDLWHLQRLLSRAAATTDTTERVRLLRRACTLFTGPLADTCTYDWLEAHRERARRQGADAHLHLAALVQDTNPREAADLLDRAITIDPFTESLYCRAMTARHRIGDHDGIRRLRRSLTAALSHLDAEPSEATYDLINELFTPAARS